MTKSTMPTYRYTARGADGKRVEGTVEAVDRRAALLQIERRGCTPVSVEEEKDAPSKKGASSPPEAPRSLAVGAVKRTSQRARMKLREVLVFTTELRDLLVSGMTLGNALNSMASRHSGRPSDGLISDLRDEIVRGSSLSDAMAKHPATFGNLYVSMIRAGEAGGAMHEVLERLVRHYERVQELKEKIVMALIYPAIVLVMGTATLVFSMVYVIPKFKVVFVQLKQTLPLPTRILIGASEWLGHYGVFLAGGIGIGAVLFSRALKTERGRLWWDGILLRVPLLKGIVASGMYANFARTLGTLLANGVPVLDALAIVEHTVGNAVVAREIQKARDRVTDGTTISGPLAAGKVLPPIMTDMMAIGEQTGDMPSALGHIAHRYENELDRHVKIFTTALEPILIVVVAVMVGFVAISILMAVFNLTNGLNA